MHNATEVNNNELVTCACDYQEGTGKKDTTLESGIENKNLCSCLSNLWLLLYKVFFFTYKKKTLSFTGLVELKAWVFLISCASRAFINPWTSKI